MFKYALIICISFFIISDVKEMSWSDSYKLTWDDFRGEPNYSSDAVAVTASGITFGYSVEKTRTRIIGFESKVSAFFYPEHSWCKLEQADDHILGHEQLHFDITELHARKFRKYLSQLTASPNIASTLQALHEKIESDLSNMQHDYDMESNYSINKEGQAKWQAIVILELAKYKAFRSKP